MCFPKQNYNFRVGFKNIKGLHDKNGCKIGDCSNEFSNDIEFVSETWGCPCEKQFNGYEMIAETLPQKHEDIKKGRKSGGLIALGKKGIIKQVKMKKKSKNFIWLEISRHLIPGLEKNLYVVAAYINDITSKYYDPNVFEELSADIANFCDLDTPLIITGDLNSRIAGELDNYVSSSEGDSHIEASIKSHLIPKRNNCDRILNAHGKKIIEICRTFNCSVLNGRFPGDPYGLFTFYDPNLGASTVDYSICSQVFFKHIKNFMILPQNELSDHCKVVTEINQVITLPTLPVGDNYAWITRKNIFKWGDEKCSEFKNCLNQMHGEIFEIKQRLDAGLIESSGKLIQELFIKAASEILEKKKISKKVQNNSKKWFDRECNTQKRETRKIGREKNKNPSNLFLREKYNEKLKQYKRTCTSKRFLYWNNKFDEIENALYDSKLFWNTWKNSPESHVLDEDTGITGERWFNHFSNLHSQTFENVLPLIAHKEPDHFLNQPITKQELIQTIKNLSGGKATGYDNICNEMVKNAPDQVLNLLLDFINLCLEKAIISESLCYDIIQPIFKSDDKSDPNNYRGICMSSSILKLITSLIYQRLLVQVDKLNLINKNQIGFMKKSRTSDHLLTLKNISKKYVTIGKKKLFLCFIDFQKAFDSVWHKGLFYKLRTMGLNGNLIDLVENIYAKTKCAVKEGNKITHFFKFSKGVRQGCPLSPLLFNLYINEIFQTIDMNTKSDITLNGPGKINVLMYADDLVIIAQSQSQLQEHVNQLSEFCDAWGLKINTKKTKCMVLNRGNRMCNLNISIKNKNIENVKSFKYLGFTIAAKNCSFVNTPIDLSIKAKRAIFALNNKIKLSLLPTRLALKIFMTQISPILLYGCEVWGPYLNYDYYSWENSETEKVFTQFIKRILGCAIQSPNIMLRSEVGTRPLLSNIIRRSILYIKSTSLCDETLANQALDLETDLYDDHNIFSLVRKYTPFYQENYNFLEPKDKKEIRNQVSLKYDELWKGG